MERKSKFVRKPNDHVILDLVVDGTREVPLAVVEWEDRGDFALVDAFLDFDEELREALGTFTPAQTEALRRFKWALENYKTADSEQIWKSIRKGQSALGSKRRKRT